MNVIRSFREKYGFPAEALEALEEAYRVLFAHREAFDRVRAEVAVYENDLPFEPEKAFCTVEEAAREIGVPVRTLELLFLIWLTPHLKEIYRRENLPEDMYDGAVLDLKWKTLECKAARGYWGTFLGWWNIDFFLLNRFTFGRLQFDLQSFPKDYDAGFRQGEPYINTHIPSSGPLIREEYLDSYRRAAPFFKERCNLERVVFGCRSWLLSPNNEQILPPTSNILPFARDFTILETKHCPENGELWRIFGTMTMPADLRELPADTSLRRAFIRWFASGGTLDSAFGAFVYQE